MPLVSGEERTGVDAGLLVASSVSGRVWEDLDASGAQGEGEPGLVGLEVRLLRSEERRVGKECRSRWSPYH